MNKQYKNGFTLVGMLITLCVIAAFFTLMMPNLKEVPNSKKPQSLDSGVKQISFQSLLEKASSDLTQGLNAILGDFQCNDLKSTGIFSSTGNNQMLGEALVKNMSVIKDCKMTPNTGCFSSKYDAIPGEYRFLTIAGASVMLNNNRNDCSQNTPYPSICGYVYVDVNGLQMPNKLGQDIFYFYITNNSGYILYPQGGLSNQ